jgi:hypothetical protein
MLMQDTSDIQPLLQRISFCLIQAIQATDKFESEGKSEHGDAAHLERN